MGAIGMQWNVTSICRAEQIRQITLKVSVYCHFALQSSKSQSVSWYRYQRMQATFKSNLLYNDCDMLSYHCFFPASTTRWTNVGSTLVRRRRRWANIEPTLVQRLVFTGFYNIPINTLPAGPAFIWFLFHQSTKYQNPFCQIWIIFTHLKLSVASARRNFEWVKIPIK